MRVRGFLLIGVVLALNLATAAPAAAHATLVSSDPVQGAHLEESPPDVTLVFDEAVTMLDGALVVADLHGTRVDHETLVHGADGRSVTVELDPDLPDGTYLVSWRIVSADSHATGGSTDFGVGVVPARGLLAQQSTPPLERRLDALAAVARSVTYAGEALLLGTALVLLAAARRGLAPTLRARRTTRRLLWAGWWGIVAGTLATLVVQVARAGPGGTDGLGRAAAWEATLRAPVGVGIIVRLGVLVVAAVLLIRGVRTRAAAVVALVATVLLAVSTAVAGHAATGSDAVLAVASVSVHVLAMSIWFGGVVLLLASLRGSSRPDAVAVLPVWRGLAFWSVVALVLTGLYQSIREVRDPAALWTTTYGRVLLVKVAVVLVIVLLARGARALLDRVGGPPTRDLRRKVAVEVVAGAVVLVLSAVLVGLAPARTAYAPGWSGAVDLGDLTADVRVDRARSGPDVVRLTVADGSGEPVYPETVSATLTDPAAGIGPLPVVLRRDYASTGPGVHYVSVGTVVPSAGSWDLAVTVTLDRYTALTGTVTYAVR